MTEDEKNHEKTGIDKLDEMIANIKKIAETSKEIKELKAGGTVMSEQIIFTLSGMDASMWRMCQRLYYDEPLAEFIPKIFKLGIAFTLEKGMTDGKINLP